MLVVDKFHVKIRHTYTLFFSYVFKICIGFMLSNFVNEKNVYMFSYVFQKWCWFRSIKFFKSQKNTFAMRNTQYNIELSVHKQPSEFNATYTIQCRVKCLNDYFSLKSTITWHYMDIVIQEVPNEIQLEVYSKRFSYSIKSDLKNSRCCGKMW